MNRVNPHPGIGVWEKGKMQYKIGDVTKITGLSIEGVRMYERAGIIASQREDGNRYRKYGYLDITSMIRSRILRAFGFSLKEIAEMTNEGTIGSIIARFEDRKHETMKEICLLEKKSELLTEMQMDMDAAERNLNSISILEAPAFFRIEFSRNGEITGSGRVVACVREWMEYAPFIHFSSRYSGKDTYGGLAIQVRYADLFGIRENDLVSYHPAAQSLQYILCESENDYGMADNLEAIRLFCDTHRFNLAGDLYSHSIFGTHKATSYKRYKKIIGKINP